MCDQDMEKDESHLHVAICKSISEEAIAFSTYKCRAKCNEADEL